jgi:hypothetical protein
VADILADLRLDVVAIAAGLLHDIVEDTRTRSNGSASSSRQVAQSSRASEAARLQFSRGAQPRASGRCPGDGGRHPRHPGKPADRLHNMRTLHHLPEIGNGSRRRRADIYAPIANRRSEQLKTSSRAHFRHPSRCPVALRGRWKRSGRPPRASPTSRAAHGQAHDAQIPVVSIDGRIGRLWSIHQALASARLARPGMTSSRCADHAASRTARRRPDHPPDGRRFQSGS